jgi:hypothetical protein
MPTEEVSPPPVSEPPPPEPEPTLEVELPSPSGADLGLAPPTRDGESVDNTFGPAPVVRELAPGWNQFRCSSGSVRLTEVLPVDSGKFSAIYALDEGRGVWRRYLPGVDIPGLNSLTELTEQQAIWVLASEGFSLTLPA